MDLALARSLSDLTTDFYRRTATSFDATRQAPWPGWLQLAEMIGLQRAGSLDVLDLACGNMRFERFLAGPGLSLRAWCFDSCDELVQAGKGTLDSVAGLDLHVRHLDVMETLLAGDDLAQALGPHSCDVAVSFGFLHHVSLPAHRAEVLRALVSCVRPGGLAAVSLWQFAQDERLLAKAVPVEGGDPGDYLLGWQGQRGIWRYCHSFGEAEVDELAAACAPHAEELARFSADGKTGSLNRYLVLRRV